MTKFGLQYYAGVLKIPVLVALFVQWVFVVFDWIVFPQVSAGNLDDLFLRYVFVQGLIGIFLLLGFPIYVGWRAVKKGGLLQHSMISAFLILLVIFASSTLSLFVEPPNYFEVIDDSQSALLDTMLVGFPFFLGVGTFLGLVGGFAAKKFMKRVEKERRGLKE